MRFSRYLQYFWHLRRLGKCHFRSSRFRKNELVYRQSIRFIGSLVYITACTQKDFTKTEPPTRTASEEHIFHVVGTDPLRAPQQKKQRGEANKNKVTRILVCPRFFGMHWDLLKLKCAQNNGLRPIPVLGARRKRHRFLDGRALFIDFEYVSGPVKSSVVRVEGLG